MATTVKELKATARPAGGKGAARAERRAGKVPGVIYGNNQPPLPISVDDRGPYVGGREWDLNQNTAGALGFNGVASVWASR